MLMLTNALMLGYKHAEGKRKLLIILALIFGFLFTLFAVERQDKFKAVLAKTEPWRNSESGVQSSLKSLSTKQLNDLGNSTLGFEKVFVLNLPERPDKLDAMRLTAALTGFEFDVIDGIKGEMLSPKALPGDFGTSKGRNNIIGCWRAHMNFAQAIVKEHLSSAVVFEDDTDWDVELKSQLQTYALGSQYLTNSIDDPATQSPYGDGWDLLYLGHCASNPTAEDNRRFVVENDPTVAPVKHRMNFGTIPNMDAYDNTTRIMFAASGGVCTYAYALSNRGAQKILYHLSMSVYSGPVDLGLRDMCSKKDRDFKCIGVFPQLVDSHRGAGNDSRDSDISNREGNFRSKGFTHNIVHSTRLNVNNLISGGEIENQWEKDMEPLEAPMKLSWKTEAEQ